MIRIPLPEHLVADARAFSSGDREPAAAKDAATVVLLGQEGVYLLRRQTSMAFAAGMCVFPGGGVDPRDFHEVPWAGPSASVWRERLGATSDDHARALVCAAVRETFEESGVLLAGPSATEVVSDTTSDSFEADREALVSKELAFSAFLTQRGLVLRSDLLGAWSGWLTPVFEPRRYRTWFFVAVLPEGQRTRDVSTESSSVTWLPAAEVLSLVEGGEMFMLPPTYMTCLEVAGFDSPADVLAASAERTVEMFMPEVTEDGDEFVLSRPASMEPLLQERFR